MLVLFHVARRKGVLENLKTFYNLSLHVARRKGVLENYIEIHDRLV